MLHGTKNSWTLRLGVFLFLAGQFIAAAHASEFGVTPHEHNGYSCLAVLLDDPELPAPAVELRTPALNDSVRMPVQLASAAPINFGHVVCPPATGPPSI